MLVLYGLAASQPCRAVMWLLEWKGISHKFVDVFPGRKQEGGSRHPSFLEIAPTGTVPALHDPERNLTLWESNAILCYLAEKYDLVDLYPTDIGQRALVNQWLHWHHGNSRQFTYALFAPVVRKDLKISQEQVDRDTKRLTGIARTMDNHLKVHRYLTGDDVSLADIACYEDVGQCNEQNIQLFDFSPYPSVVDWMHRMEQLPGFKESHGVVLKLKKFFKKSNI